MIKHVCDLCGKPAPIPETTFGDPMCDKAPQYVMNGLKVTVVVEPLDQPAKPMMQRFRLSADLCPGCLVKVIQEGERVTKVSAVTKEIDMDGRAVAASPSFESMLKDAPACIDCGKDWCGVTCGRFLDLQGAKGSTR